MSGVFITFEGGEGSGKTTQIKKLATYLQDHGIKVVMTKEPGGTEVGKEFRKIVCTGDKDKMDPVSEALVYYADRNEHVKQVVLPAVEQGKWVISDRFADSTTAYQYYGYNKRVAKETLDALYKMTVGDFHPDLTIILDIDPRVGLSRSLERNNSSEVKEIRFEQRDVEFHDNLRRGFLEIAKTADRYVVLDANKSIDELHKDIVAVVNERLLNKSNSLSKGKAVAGGRSGR